MELLLKLGPLLSGIGLIFGSLAAWGTLLYVHKKSIRLEIDKRIDERKKEFGELHVQFWKDKDSAIVRSWLVNEVKYKELESILQERLKVDENNLCDADNEKLELLDRFCALFARIAFSDSDVMTQKERVLWTLNFNYWITAMRNRGLVEEYISKYWPGILHR